MSIRGMRYRPEIDGLRAIAVLAVMLYHAGLPVPAGFVGVDVFFVISGFLITRLLQAELQRDGRIDFFDFYARRARRILPALFVVVLVTLAVSALVLGDGFGQVARSAAAAGVFVGNWFFQAATGDYWAPDAATMPLLHLWSLSVEEQFYLFWPLLLFAFRKAPTCALIALAIASFALAEVWLWHEPAAAFFQMPSRFWELAAGGLVALRPMRLPRGAGPGALVVVLVSTLLPFSHFPGAGALPAVLGSAVLLAAIDGEADLGFAGRFLRARAMVTVGLLSYSLYLWHWPLLAIDRAMRVGEAPVHVRLALCGAALLLAWLSYRYVETPCRRWRAPSRRVVGAGAGLALVLSCGAFAAGYSTRPATALADPAISLRCQPDMAGQPVRMQLPRCVPGAGKVAIWGDSYAFSWAPLAQEIAQAGRLPAVTLARDYCPPLTGVTLERRSPAETRGCKAHNDQALAYLTTSGVDTVILASRWLGYLQANTPDARRGLRTTVIALAPHVRRILIIGPTPEMLDDVPKCQALHESCAIERAAFEAGAAESRRAMETLAKLPNVEILDAASWLCGPTSCPGVRDGMALYRDRRHVSEKAAAAFAGDYVKSSRGPGKIH